MEAIFWGASIFIAACAVWAFGYLTAAREFGKDVSFYKDCIRTLRNQLIEAEKVKSDDDTREYPGIA
jgi:hypothetical protein